MNPYKDFNDTGLLPLLNNGDKKAYEAIYDRYAEAIYQYVFNRVHIKEDAEEIVQEVFLSIWIKHETIHITSSLGAYLYSVAKHKIFNYIRSDKVWKKYAADFSLFIAEKYDNSVEDMMIVADISLIVDNTLAQLPVKCQSAYRLSRKENMNIPDIAKTMGISTRTVENYLSQALKHLRESLSKF